MVAAKPITTLLLLNKQVGAEYRDACAKRIGILVSDYIGFCVVDSWDEPIESTSDTKKASFIHLHVGDWLDPFMGDNADWDLSPLKDWLAHWSAQMPRLDSVTVSIYVYCSRIETAEERMKVKAALKDFVSAPKLREVEVVTMECANEWDLRCELDPKKLLVRWTPAGASDPQLLDPPTPYMETCCECTEHWFTFSKDRRSDSHYSGSFSDVSGGDPDDSSSQSDDGNQNDDGDGDNSNSDDVDDENDDSGNGSDGDMNDNDEEDAENEDQDEDHDADNDSDESGSGDSHATGDSQTNQAPSYFDFFGLPPEIRDMIYDQPEMLDPETPLRHYDDLSDFHYSSNQMAITKPRTSLLTASKQFSSEYAKRCEGRSGLFISERLDEFETARMRDLEIPPKVAENASFMHIHAGDWMNPEDLISRGRGLGAFKSWLSECTSQMPKLKNISVNFYTAQVNVSEPATRDLLIQHLGTLTSVEQVAELRLIVMKEPYRWLSWRSKHAAKRLLVHWKRRSGVHIQATDRAVDYEEDCCDGSLADDFVEEDEDASSDYDSDDCEDDDE